MKKAALAAAALGAVTISALGRCRRRLRPERRHRLEPPRGAADRRGSERRQHRPVRVPEPGQAEHGHDRLQLDPGRGSGGRPELLHVLAVREVQAQHRPDGDARPDIVYEFRFGRTAGPAFLGNTVQSWSMWRNKKLFARGKTPPNNIGPRSTPNYPSLVSKSIVRKDGLAIFAGQRDDAFFGDIGAIFDLLAFRKGTGANGGGKDFFAGYAVHAIALQIPIAELLRRRTRRSASGRRPSART